MNLDDFIDILEDFKHKENCFLIDVKTKKEKQRLEIRLGMLQQVIDCLKCWKETNWHKI